MKNSHRYIKTYQRLPQIEMLSHICHKERHSSPANYSMVSKSIQSGNFEFRYLSDLKFIEV